MFTLSPEEWDMFQGEVTVSEAALLPPMTQEESDAEDRRLEELFYGEVTPEDIALF